MALNQELTGKVLQRKRRQLGLTQADVCRKLNVSRNTVAYWETGVSAPSFKHVAMLADLYGCSIDELAVRD